MHPALPTESSSLRELQESDPCRPEQQRSCCRHSEKGQSSENEVAFDLSRGWKRSLQRRAHQVRSRGRPQQKCRGGIWTGKVPAKSEGLIPVPGCKLLWPAVALVPPRSPVLGMCSMETGARRKCRFRQQIPEPWAQRAQGQVWSNCITRTIRWAPS